MALECTQPLTEMSTRNHPGGKGRPALEADNLTAICEPIVYKMWELQRLTTLWAFTARYKDSIIGAGNGLTETLTSGTIFKDEIDVSYMWAEKTTFLDAYVLRISSSKLSRWLGI
jgi:hypothetical protein